MARTTEGRFQACLPCSGPPQAQAPGHGVRPAYLQGKGSNRSQLSPGPCACPHVTVPAPVRAGLLFSCHTYRWSLERQAPHPGQPRWGGSRALPFLLPPSDTSKPARHSSPLSLAVGVGGGLSHPAPRTPLLQGPDPSAMTVLSSLSVSTFAAPRVHLPVSTLLLSPVMGKVTVHPFHFPVTNLSQCPPPPYTHRLRLFWPHLQAHLSHF